MKKLTIKQKHNIYKAALEEFYSDDAFCGFMCFCIKLALLHKNDIRITDEEFKILFPEFMSFKPKRLYCKNVWFNTGSKQGYNKRIKILEACIEMTKPKTK